MAVVSKAQTVRARRGDPVNNSGENPSDLFVDVHTYYTHRNFEYRHDPLGIVPHQGQYVRRNETRSTTVCLTPDGRKQLLELLQHECKDVEDED